MALSRRVVIRRGAAIFSAFTLWTFTRAHAEGADLCGDPTSEPLRSTLHYTNSAPNPAQSCNACSFFTPEEGNQPCGKCQIMSGPVNPNGHCDSWAKK